MASAGRILIIPKGEWNAEVEYEMLDLVFKSGASWIAKKNVVGIEPTEENVEYWMKMCEGADLAEIMARLQALENQMVSAASSDDIEEKLGEFEDKLGQSVLSTDLFATYDKPTFVQWNSATLNTPYKSGLTGCVDGFAIVYGDYSKYHTVVAWTKGGGTINYFIHQVNNGTVLDWETFLKSSGGTLTGDLSIYKSLPRLHLTNKDTSRKARIEASNDGTVKIGNYKSDTDHISFQVRDSSVGLENILRVVVDGDKMYRPFGEHNIELAKNLLGISNGLKIATGSYKGVGTFGADNKNSITFSFIPKVVFITPENESTYDGTIIWTHGTNVITLRPVSSNNGVLLGFSLSETTLSWYQANGANYQLNTGDKTYHWVAIG